MNDLISRQAAIDAMTNILWHYPNECYRNLNEYEFAKGLAELGLKSVPSAQQWHTGEPTEDGDYLVYKYGDDDGFSYFDVDTFYAHEGTVEHGTPLAYRGWQDDHDRVVAWMPLPEPPEVDEDGTL